MSKEKSEKTSQPVRVSFLGDISLNDDYIKMYKSGERPFDEIQSCLTGKDLIIGNLECMASGNGGENELKRPRLTTTTETLNYLDDINVSLITLAQNHVYDHLLDGFLATRRRLEDLGIQYMGAGLDPEISKEPKILSKRGVTVGFLNYVTEDTNPNLPENAEICLNRFDEERIVREIHALKKETDQVVLLLHWGGLVEDGFYPHPEQQKMARRFIDEGADLIIGHHPHTLQPMEEYKGKSIFYSLGNFCFSNIIFEGKKIRLQKRKHTESVIVNIHFFKEDYDLNFVPIENMNGYIKVNQQVLHRFERRNRIFKMLGTNRPFWFLYQFKLRKMNPVFNYLNNPDAGMFEKIRNLKMRKILNFLKNTN